MSYSGGNQPAKLTGRFRLAIGLFNLLLAGLLAGLVGPVPSQAATGTGIVGGADSPFGMNVQSAARYMARGSGDNFSTPLDPAKAAGVGWDREEIGWNMVEPTAGNWDWSLPDAAINASGARGINVLGLLAYNVDRSGGGKARPSHSMPDLGQWSNYVSQVVNRYKNRVHYWQIWNEPQDPTYFTSASPVDYARLLAASNTAIKNADPGAKVLAAGFVPVDNGIDWMNQLLAQPGGNQFDILSVHPYVNDPTPRQGGSMSPERAYWSTTDMNQVSNYAAKLGKPVWATEFGWSTVDTDPGIGRFNHVSPDLQADYISRAYVTGLSTSSIQKFFLYQFHDDNTNPNDRYGLLDTNWQPTKPSYNAYKNMVGQLTGATPQGPVSPYEGTSRHTNLFGFEGTSGAAFSCGGGQGGNGFWSCYGSSPAQAQASLTAEKTHSGGQSMKINYNFQAGTEGRYVVVSPLDSATGQLAGLRNLTKFGLWLNGDGNRTIVRLTITDAAGQFISYDMGRMGPSASGWQRYEAQLAFPNETGRTIQYPIKNIGVLLDGRFQTEAYGGTTYIDDIYAEDTPPVYMYRFNKGGQDLDVVWADNAQTSVSLPTSSSQATVYNRDGQAQTISASGGQITLQVSDAPQYVVYKSAINTGGGSGGSVSPPPPTPGACGSADESQKALFQPTWSRWDEAITSGLTKRSWMWGPTSFRLSREPYDEAPGGCRTVLYWDKSRMEITNPAGNQADKYFVTNGLLAKELISGQFQLGNSHFGPSPIGPARIPAAGDGANNPKAPTYASFARVTTLKDGENWQNNRGAATVTDTLDQTGSPGNNGSLAGYNVRLTNYVDTTHHNIADVFWQFMNSRGPIRVGNAFQDGDAVDWVYSIGLPLSEPYWARVVVGGVEKDVLIQVFERRVLTYTPSNSDGYKVEMGNIGGHYATWRYGLTPSSLQP